MELEQHLRSLGWIKLSATQCRNFQLYEQALLDWNRRINLTAIRNPEQIQIKHFLDSLSCLLAMGGSCMEQVVDVGTGAGFPGIPLKIACPEIQLTLVESVAKKAQFCRHIVDLLGMRGVEVLPERAENIGQNPIYRQRFDWAVARAVAEMPVLVEYLLPLVRVGGAVLAMKGEGAPAETQAAEHAVRLLGGRLRRLMPVTLPSVVEERYLVIVDKIAATPHGYPRRSGLPAKKPLLPRAARLSDTKKIDSLANQ